MTGIVIPDGGTIGSASDTDAISIASDGQITVNQNNPTVTLGSNTTFGSGVSLANATFPSGHVIQHKVKQLSTPSNAERNHDISTNWTVIDLGEAFQLTGFSATQGNKLIITVDGLNHYAITDNTYSTTIGVSTDGASVTDLMFSHSFWTDSDGSNQNIPTHFQWIYDVPANFTNKTLSVVTRKQNGAPANTWRWNLLIIANDDPSGIYRTAHCNLSVMEIQA